MGQIAVHEVLEAELSTVYSKWSSPCSSWYKEEIGYN